jgi:arylformamidase
MLNKNNSILYLSYFIDEQTPLYGGGTDVQIIEHKSIKNGDTSNNKKLSLYNHTGTHIDFPNHFFENGMLSDDYPASFWTFECPFLLKRPAFENEIIDLNKKDLANVPIDVDFLIIKTGFGIYRGEEKYWKYNPGLSPNTANILRELFPKIKIIGMDFISLTSYQNREIGREAHKKFLGGNNPILLVEDMDLSKIEFSPKQIFCLPILIKGLDGAPVTIVANF